jgi:hypothetical protein
MPESKPEDLREFREWKDRKEKAGVLAFSVPQDEPEREGDSDHPQDHNHD